MESDYLAVLSSKGQLTVPKPLRDRLQLAEGQRLVMEVEAGSGGLLIKKARVEELGRELEETEWNELKRLASVKGKRYRSGKSFLRSLKSK